MIRVDALEAMLQVENLHFRYPDGTCALAGINLRIGRGQRVALMGPNGAGKSTLLLHLNGIRLPQQGRVVVGGLEASRTTEELVRSRVGLVFQDPDDQVFSPTVWEDVCFGPLNQGLSQAEAADRAERALAAVGLLHLRARSPQRLSFGQKKRVAIAGVLAMQPALLALDEPFAYLDPEAQDGLAEILDALHEQGVTLLVATHDVDWAADWADEVILLVEGRVLAQGPPSVLTDPELVRRARLRLPRVTQLFQVLPDVQPVPYRMAQAAAALQRLKGGGACEEGIPSALR